MEEHYCKKYMDLIRKIATEYQALLWSSGLDRRSEWRFIRSDHKESCDEEIETSLSQLTRSMQPESYKLKMKKKTSLMNCKLMPTKMSIFSLL